MNILRMVDGVFAPRIVWAHCDVPCGIYKRDAMETAAETVVKMVEKLINSPEADEEDKQSPLNFHNNMTRYVVVKDQHAEICKREALILWTDFFKEEHIENYPDLHDKVWKITKLCSDCKREVNADKANELLKQVRVLGDILEASQKSAK